MLALLRKGVWMRSQSGASKSSQLRSEVAGLFTSARRRFLAAGCWREWISAMGRWTIDADSLSRSRRTNPSPGPRIPPAASSSELSSRLLSRESVPSQSPARSPPPRRRSSRTQKKARRGHKCSEPHFAEASNLRPWRVHGRFNQPARSLLVSSFARALARMSTVSHILSTHSPS